MKKLALLAAFVLAACGSGTGTSQYSSTSQFSVMPPGYDCSTVTFYLGRNFGNASFVIDNPANGTFGPMDAAGDTVTLNTPDSIAWSWSSTALIRAVFIRADVPGTALGDATNQIWLYVPSEASGAFSGAGIYTEDSANHRYPAKQIEFCFDPPTPPEFTLEVTKTAQMSFKVKKTWDVTKRSDVHSLELAPGETFEASFVVDAVITGTEVSDGKGEGTISIHNPAPVEANITGVTDVLSTGAPVTVDCGVTFPHALAAGGDLACTWTADLTNLSDQADTATVTTEGAVHGATAGAMMLAHNAIVTNVDFCAAVSDTLGGDFGTVCEDAQFTYKHTIGPYQACGPQGFTNTATLVTADTQTTDTSTVTIPIRVPCPEAGCTLTQGYWKTHSKYGPAPLDDNWANVGEDTAFFLSGKTWYQQFWIAPAGNAYWNLAHQYAAAKLNALNGASTTAVDEAMAEAEDLLGAYTPAQIGAMKASNPVRQRFVALAEILDGYTTGEIGPGHCEDRERLDCGD